MGCPPEPGLMVPLSLNTALDGTLSASFAGRESALRRALGAAEKRSWLLPSSRCAAFPLLS